MVRNGPLMTNLDMLALIHLWAEDRVAALAEEDSVVLKISLVISLAVVVADAVVHKFIEVPI